MVKLFDQPYSEPLTPTRLDQLRAAGVSPACYATGAQLLAIAAPDAGPQTPILIRPTSDRSGCKPLKVTLSERGLKV